MRFLRLFIMFDLPVQTSRNRREYRRFVKYITNAGFIRIQYSVYSKLILNRGTLQFQINKLKEQVPHDGTVQTLIVTEKQYTEMEFLVGQPSNEMQLLTTDRVIEL